MTRLTDLWLRASIDACRQVNQLLQMTEANRIDIREVKSKLYNPASNVFLVRSHGQHARRPVVGTDRHLHSLTGSVYCADAACVNEPLVESLDLPMR